MGNDDNHFLPGKDVPLQNCSIQKKKERKKERKKHLI